MRFLNTEREKELLDNAKRSLDDCLAKVKAGEYLESLRILLIGIDVLANLNARVCGHVTTEKDAEKNNQDRFVRFLQQEIPEWKEHYMEWHHKAIRLDLSELSYAIRCKQLHEYSPSKPVEFPIQLDWCHRNYTDCTMRIRGSPNTEQVEYVEVNGFFLLNRLVEVVQKYTGLFSSTPERVGCKINPFAIYEVLGTVK